jgi:hypothetical protein
LAQVPKRVVEFGGNLSPEPIRPCKVGPKEGLSADDPRGNVFAVAFGV